MVLVVAALVVGVIAYEMIVTKPRLVGAAATSPRTAATTQAGSLTSAISQAERALLQNLRPSASASPAKPASGGGGGSPSLSGGGGGGGATQTGNIQPSREAVTTSPNLTPYGTDQAGLPVYIDNEGNVYNSDGFVLTNLSGITPLQTFDNINGPSVIAQVAPGGAAGDATIPPMTADGDLSGLNDIAGSFGNGVPQLDTSGNQDVALAVDSGSVDFSQDFTQEL